MAKTAETARRFEARELDPAEQLRKDPGLAIADSGLWQHLAVPALPVADLAVLIAAVSDNYAMNILLERIGPASVARPGASLGLHRTALHDRIRHSRSPLDPATLSTGSAGELAGLMGRLARASWCRPWCPAPGRLAGDEHRPLDGRFRVPRRSLGPSVGRAEQDRTDDGIRADVGYLGATAYAVLAEWDHRAAPPLPR